MGGTLADINKWPIGVILNCICVVVPGTRVLRLCGPCVRHAFRQSSVAVKIYRCLNIPTITAGYYADHLRLSYVPLIVRTTR